MTRDVPRLAIDSGWEIARESAVLAWSSIGAPRPVAAVLAESGAWSVDGPPRRFDAETWWYRVSIAAPEAVRAAGGRLVFDGLATCCEVFFNGVSVLTAANMFRRHAVDIPAAEWRATGNELLIRFDPLDAVLAMRRPRPRWRAPMVEHQQLRFVRTTLLGRTPGWSPAAAVVGPWRGVWLEPLAEAPPQVLDRHAWLEGDDGHVRLAVWLADGPALVSAVLQAVDGGDDSREVAWTLERGADGIHRGEGVVPGARRWWPHTHGTPERYALSLRILPLRATTSTSASPRSKAPARPFDMAAAFVHPLGHVGFRTLALELGVDGAGFALQVNGQPVFCRGVCWVPLDTLRLHAGLQEYRDMLRTLRAAGVNLLRVGGTMVYEDAAFFDACDEAGVMVWQEFMFANMDYPADEPAFAAEVAAEAAQHLSLWRDHACVAVVCGNSEVGQQAAIWGADRAAWTPPLFHETLAAEVAAALPGVPYWPSSASGGAFPFQPAAGTTSYYGVGAYLRPLADARDSGVRFATECLAFAQVPDDAALLRLATLQGGTPVRTHQPVWKERVPRDLGAGWDFDDVRDHYLETQFGIDAADARRGDLAGYWSLSRAATVEAMTAAFVQWRDPASACRGALAWFLRDLRAGAGWGLLDELGHPKAAFHALARAWQPLHLGLVDGGQNGVDVYVVNETPHALDATLSIAFHQRGETPVGRVDFPLAIAAHGAFRESTLARMPGFIDVNGSYRFGPAAADVVVATLRDAQGATLRETVCFLAPVAARSPLVRTDIGLCASGQRLADARGRVRVTLRTRAAARGVHFDAPGWRCSDEYFDLAPGAEAHVDFTPVHPEAGSAQSAWYARIGAVNALDMAPVPLGAPA